jgi:hypothetical protein
MIFTSYGPKYSKEMKRILNLSKRNSLNCGKNLQIPLTKLLKTSKGTQILRPLQALAIFESYEYSGAFISLSVGEGKTLISFLIPTLYNKLNDKQNRATLLLPSRLMTKNKKDFDLLAFHWQSSSILFLSFEELSRKSESLNNQNPEILIVDEAHHLNNQKSAVTKRVKKYLKNNPNTVFICMSGTIVKRSFLDWSHLIRWSLPINLQPLPINYKELNQWAGALDENPRVPCSLGALKIFGKTRTEARENFGKHMKQIPGIIVSNKKNVNIDIKIKYHNINIKGITKTADYCRKYWKTPKGTEFLLALDKARHLREISQGFCYEWQQPPPKDWLSARRNFSNWVNVKLSRSRLFETETQIINEYNDHPIIKEWINIKKSYTPITIPDWYEYEGTIPYFEFIRQTTKFLSYKKNNLIWVYHDAIGKKYSKIYKIPFFSRKGKSKNGLYINDFKGTTAIVSIKAITEGFNLQHFSNNLVLCPPKLGKTWEQMIGRTARSGQKNKIEFHIFGTILENLEDMKQAIKDAKYIENTLNTNQFLNNIVLEIE